MLERDWLLVITEIKFTLRGKDAAWSVNLLKKTDLRQADYEDLRQYLRWIYWN